LVPRRTFQEKGAYQTSIAGVQHAVTVQSGVDLRLALAPLSSPKGVMEVPASQAVGTLIDKGSLNLEPLVAYSPLPCNLVDLKAYTRRGQRSFVRLQECEDIH
jgi:hypothetical protein